MKIIVCTKQIRYTYARTGKNPQNGKSINISAKTVVKFKAGKAMGAEVNNG